MAWVYLLMAGLLEIVWATGLKYTHGFTRLWPTAFTLSTVLVSFLLLAIAMKTLPIGTAYAVWTGIGIIGAVAVGIIVFGEPVTFVRIACVSMIMLGIIGLKLTTH